MDTNHYQFGATLMNRLKNAGEIQIQAGERISLDIHAHLAPIMPERLKAMDAVEWNATDMRLILDGGHAIAIKSLFQPDALIEWMDENGIEQSWVSIPPPLYRQTLDFDQARQWVGYINDGLEIICDANRARLSPLCHLPIEHPAIAQEIAAACIARGITRFSAAAGGKNRHVFSAPSYDGLWETLNGNECFLFLHPGSCGDARLASFYLENLLGNPHETSVAVAHLIFGGVCERYQRIQFCLAHGGGTAAMLVGRFQHGFETGRSGVDTSRIAPRDILKRFMVDSILHDPDAVALAAHVFGHDHVLFGSDWPFPMGLITPHQQLSGIGAALRHQILSDNADDLKRRQIK
jgi:aminocarboxymuconate-semialdehyde decarboxylase